MAQRMARTAAAGSVRIIAGQWRGRRLAFPARAGLRPTGDRLRETLFNWLQPHCPGAHCLDLFAGSGALGLEAASRGAAWVTLVERDPETARALRANCALLGAGMTEVIEADALAWLAGPPPATPYDIAFVDPPFAAAAPAAALRALAAPGWLAERAWIYLETARDRPPPALPERWCRHREAVAGAVRCQLFRCI